MAKFEQAVIDQLVANPTESLNVEIKRWIDPVDVDGQAKIVKASLGLRNRNGGYLLIGFDDKTLEPDITARPALPRNVFRHDMVQALVSKYSSQLFEVAVAWGTRDGMEFPVIVIPTGVVTPVACTRDLIRTTDNAQLLRKRQVYFRTLGSNGTPSTATAEPYDWEDIVKICFNNREADFGGFIRRQLGGNDLSSLANMMFNKGLSDPPKSLRERAEQLLDEGYQASADAIVKRGVADDEEQRLSIAGTWNVALVIDPPKKDARATDAFRNTLASANPQYTGWPIWLDASRNTDVKNRPTVSKGMLQYLIISIMEGFSNHLDFARFDPKGEFYLRRVLQDDAVPSRVKPGTALDPIIVILRVAEAMLVGMAFANALGWKPSETKLGFAFSWTQLGGRMLSTWSRPYSSFTSGVADDDTATTFVEFSLEVAPASVAQFVTEATRDLFIAFNGEEVPQSFIEDLVTRLLNRNLNF